MHKATDVEYLDIINSPLFELVREKEKKGEKCADIYVIRHKNGFEFSFGKAFVIVERGNNPNGVIWKKKRWYLLTANNMHWVANEICDGLLNGLLKYPVMSGNKKIVVGWR